MNLSHKSSCQATLNKVQINVSKTRRCLVQSLSECVYSKLKNARSVKKLGSISRTLICVILTLPIPGNRIKNIRAIRRGTPVFRWHLLFNLQLEWMCCLDYQTCFKSTVLIACNGCLHIDAKIMFKNNGCLCK